MPTQSAAQSRPSSPNRTPPPGRRTPWVWYGLGAIVVAAAIIAVVASSGGSDKKAVVPAGVKQTRPVTVTGAPLPTFAGNPDPAVGQKAPTLHGKSFDGKPVAVTPGRPTLVLFVAHWCPHCQREVPLLVKYLKAHPLPAGLDMVTVATSTSSADPNYPPSAWLARAHWPTPVMADSASGTAANAYGLPAFPYFVALDSSGKVVGRTSGEITTDQFAKLATGSVKGQVVTT